MKRLLHYLLLAAVLIGLPLMVFVLVRVILKQKSVLDVLKSQRAVGLPLL